MDDPVSYLLVRDGQVRHRQGDGRHELQERPVARRRSRTTRTASSASYEVDPNKGMEAVRELEAAVKELGVKAATAFPAGLTPQVPINDKKFYPIYAKCVELDIPICVCAGVPGPRVPFAPQDVELIDEVCWFFPELKFVTRHGCEPWADLAVKLMLKWPNLHYSTSAFAPKYYPKDVIHYANTRGADKVMYAGYFPMGLTLDRIFDGHARRAVPRPRVAEVPPRERGPRLQARRVSDDRADQRGVRGRPRRWRDRHVPVDARAARREDEGLRLHPQADDGRRVASPWRCPRSTCSRACPKYEELERPGRRWCSPRWTSTASA